MRPHVTFGPTDPAKCHLTTGIRYFYTGAVDLYRGNFMEEFFLRGNERLGWHTKAEQFIYGPLA